MKSSVAFISGLSLAASTIAFTVNADQVEIEHSLGKTLVESNPQRVVVLGVGPLDILDSLGVDPVAVTKVSQLPEYLHKYKADQYIAAGSLFEPDFEKIFTSKPDLIVAGPRSASHYKELTEIAPTIVVGAGRNQSYWDATQEQWRKLGRVFEQQDFVERKISELDAEFKAIRDYNQSNKVDALTVMSSGGNVTTFGAQSRFSVIYKDFGFKETVEGIKPSRHGDAISYEFIQQSNPSTLLILDRDAIANPGTSDVKTAFDNDLVHATKAHKQNSVAYLDAKAWYLTISGITATETMVEDVKGALNLK